MIFAQKYKNRFFSKESFIPLIVTAVWKKKKKYVFYFDPDYNISKAYQNQRGTLSILSLSVILFIMCMILII